MTISPMIISKKAKIEVPSLTEPWSISLRTKFLSREIHFHRPILEAASAVKQGKEVSSQLRGQIKRSPLLKLAEISLDEYFFIFATYEHAKNDSHRKTHRFTQARNTKEWSCLRKEVLLGVRVKLAIWELLCIIDSDTYYSELVSQCPLYMTSFVFAEKLLSVMLGSTGAAEEFINKITPTKSRKTDFKGSIFRLDREIRYLETRLRNFTALENLHAEMSVKRREGRNIESASETADRLDEIKANHKWLSSNYSYFQNHKAFEKSAEAAMKAVAQKHGLSFGHLKNQRSEANQTIQADSRLVRYSYDIYIEGDHSTILPSRPTMFESMDDSLHVEYWDEFRKLKKRPPSLEHWNGIGDFTWKQLIAFQIK